MVKMQQARSLRGGCSIVTSPSLQNGARGEDCRVNEPSFDHTMIDLHLLQLINREWSHPLLDRVMPVISDLKAWIPVILLLVIRVLWQSRGRCWRQVVGIGLCLLATDNLVGYPMKHLAGKQRPNESVSWVLKRSPARHPVRLLAFTREPVIKPVKLVPLGQRGYSFPSNHVLNTTGVLTFIWLAWGGWTRWLFLIVPVLCWSRIYCGAHWPSDMPHSIIFAVVTGWAMHHLLRKWMRLPPRQRQPLPARLPQSGLKPRLKPDLA